jgi:metal-responsive CopG/Arc/MetJ family transcriptional regulator
MAAIVQIVLDEDLLRLVDRFARRSKMNRSALVRDALKEYLRTLELRELESRDRKGYEQHPERDGEFTIWEKVTAWPED